MLEPLDHLAILNQLKVNEFVFIGTISFEERATAWAKSLVSNAAIPRKCYLFDYDTNAEPVEADKGLREGCRDFFFRFLCPPGSFPQIVETLHPFAINRLCQATEEILADSASSIILIDITCMTRVHLFATVSAIKRMAPRPIQIYFCYSTPGNYGPRSANRFGWRDVLFLPIGKRRLFHREGLGRGIIFAGYDGERLSVALTEIEPASGCMVYSNSIRRPDFLTRAREANRVVESRLNNLRMPRTSTPRSDSDKWTKEVIDTFNFGQQIEAVKPQVTQAMKEDSPVIVFPYGPKPVTLSLALAIQDWCVDEAWAVYPIPERFSVSYSIGVGDCYIFRQVRPPSLNST